MRSFHESAHFSPRAVNLFRKAERLVYALPDQPVGHVPWRCHEIARVVGECLELPVVDGWYGRVDHSWLVITDHDAPSDMLMLRPEAVLDVYACGSLPQVQLLDFSHSLGHTASFRAGPQRTDIRDDVIASLRKHVGRS